MIYKIFAFFFLTLFTIQLTAQEKTKTEFSRRPQPDPKIQNLKVGDQVPDILIQKIIRDTKTVAKMSNFKDQLLILDFWDTFCGSCIEALPKLDSLQQRFGDKIKILPVTYQAEKVMTTFFKNNQLIKDVKLPCVVEDKILGSYFQYKLISHVVWIDKGKVTAITGTDYVTAKNIQTILNGEKVNWPVKNDMVSFDPNEPIFTQNQVEQYNTKSGFLKYSGVTGHREGIDYKRGIAYDTVRNLYRTSFYNFSIPEAFNRITYAIKKRNFILSPGRLILEVKDRSKYIYDKSFGFPSDWNRQNKICYEFVSAKPLYEKQRLEYILEDLSHILGVNARWEKRKIKCFVIVRNKVIANIDSVNNFQKRHPGEKYLVSIRTITGLLDEAGKYPPAIDETGGMKSSMIISAYNDIEGLKNQLKMYGCDIIESDREIEVLVITEKGL